jgi:hypothetical protein
MPEPFSIVKTTTGRTTLRETSEVDELDQFITEDSLSKGIEAVSILKPYSQDEEFLPQSVVDAVRDEVAGALRTLRAEQLWLADRLVESMITWTIGTGIAVAAVVIIVIKWL